MDWALSAAVIRAARGLLGINQTDLARRAKVGVATLKRVEGSDECLRVTVETLLRLQRALETAGILFVPQTRRMGQAYASKSVPPSAAA